MTLISDINCKEMLPTVHGKGMPTDRQQSDSLRVWVRFLNIFFENLKNSSFCLNFCSSERTFETVLLKYFVKTNYKSVFAQCFLVVIPEPRFIGKKEKKVINSIMT